MFRTRCVLAFSLLLPPLFAQEPTPAPPGTPAQSEPSPPAKSEKPQIKLNILNVCTPAESEKQEIAAALSRIPEKGAFSQDFEVTRGRATVPDTGPARYIRLRRELTGNSIFNIVQYSLSADPKNTVETLVFKAKDPKDLLLVSIEDDISASAASPGAALEADTPASHIKLERFGKSSLVLARCENADQTSYEPLFTRASQVAAAYRKSLGLRTMFRNELHWLTAAMNEKPAAKKSTNAAKTDPKN